MKCQMLFSVKKKKEKRKYFKMSSAEILLSTLSVEHFKIDECYQSTIDDCELHKMSFTDTNRTGSQFELFEKMNLKTDDKTSTHTALCDHWTNTVSLFLKLKMYTRLIDEA